jgi:flagellar hook-associated protein 1 FlgK
VLKTALASLNRIAVAVGAEVNRVHNGGAYYDTATGTMKAGGDFFSGVVAKTGATTSWIGVGMTNNTLQNYDFTVSYNGANYTVTRTPAGGPAIPAVAAGVEVTDANGTGLGFSISAGTPAPAAGDTWQLNFQDYAHSMSAQLTNIEKIAAANLVTGAAAANTGTAKIISTQVSSAATLPLPAQISLTYNSGLGQFAVAGAVPGVPNIAYTSPGPQTLKFNGIGVTISGTPANGDVFTVNNTGPGDNSNALALAALQTTGILDNGSTTFTGAYTQLVSSSASLASEADLNSQAFSALTAQAKDAQQSQAGVNLDEEAVNLIRFQQSYQAAAKAISVATSLFDEILAIGR